jgi:hypothetical protein
MENKDYYIRMKGRKPRKMKCDNNLIDDGYNCIDKPVCKRKKLIECPNNSIVTSYQERLKCYENEELIDDLCYKRCTTGYVSDGYNCVKGLDNIISEKISIESNTSNSKSNINNVITKVNNKIVFLYDNCNIIINRFLKINKWYLILIFCALIYVIFIKK